jgi:hypothetical protein
MLFSRDKLGVHLAAILQLSEESDYCVYWIYPIEIKHLISVHRYHGTEQAMRKFYDSNNEDNYLLFKRAQNIQINIKYSKNHIISSHRISFVYLRQVLFGRSRIPASSPVERFKPWCAAFCVGYRLAQILSKPIQAPCQRH